MGRVVQDTKDKKEGRKKGKGRSNKSHPSKALTHQPNSIEEWKILKTFLLGQFIEILVHILNLGQLAARWKDSREVFKCYFLQPAFIFVLTTAPETVPCS